MLAPLVLERPGPEPCEVVWDALAAPLVVPPAPPVPSTPPAPPASGPGVPAVPARSWSLHVVAAEPLSHAPITVFSSGEVSGWEDVWGVDEAPVGVSVSPDDPGWIEVADHYGVAGLPVPDGVLVDWRRVVGRVEWQVWRADPDGSSSLVASGDSRGPVALGDRIDLQVRGGGARLTGRMIGQGGTFDLLDGRGRFEGAWLGGAPGPGWSASGVEVRWSSDAYEGDRCLEVRGNGFLFSPYARAQAASAITGPHASAVLVTSGPGVSVRCDYSRVGGGASVTGEVGPADYDPAGDTWQQVESSPVIAPAGVASWRARMIVAVGTGTWTRIDLARIVHEEMLGSLAPIGVEQYPVLLLREAQKAGAGGPLGIRARVHRASPSTAVQTWLGVDDPRAASVLDDWSDRVDGPDLWITPDHVLHIDGVARGQYRPDLVLDDWTVIDAEVTVDPAARADQLRARVGSAAGAARQAIGVDQPVTPGVLVQRVVELAPPELSYRSAERWAQGRAVTLSSEPLVVTATVPWWWATHLDLGDTVRAAVIRDGLAVAGLVRLFHRRWNVDPSTATLMLAVDRGDT